MRNQGVESLQTQPRATSRSHAEAQFESLLTPLEVCQLLGIRRSTLYTWVARHKIPYAKVGSLLRFPRSDILAWLEARKG